MSPPNGHAKDPNVAAAANYSSETHAVPVPPEFSGNQRFSQQEIKDFCAEIPFDPELIDWRVTNTTKNGKLRGHVLEYQLRRSFPTAYPTVLIGKSKTLGDERPVNPKITPKPDTDERQPPSPKLATPLDWRGKKLRVAVCADRGERLGDDRSRQHRK
jgi:hypothetical protein